MSMIYARVRLYTDYLQGGRVQVTKGGIVRVATSVLYVVFPFSWVVVELKNVSDSKCFVIMFVVSFRVDRCGFIGVCTRGDY